MQDLRDLKDFDDTSSANRGGGVGLLLLGGCGAVPDSTCRERLVFYCHSTQSLYTSWRATLHKLTSHLAATGALSETVHLDDCVAHLVYC